MSMLGSEVTRHGPADHFPPGGGVDIEDDVLLAAAIPVHHTKTSDGAWDGSANEKRLGDSPTVAQLKAMYAWKPDNADDAKSRSNYKFPHHEVATDGKVGPANLKACSTIIGSLNGGRGGAKIPDSARAGVYAHAKAHLIDGGVDAKDVPKLMSVEIATQIAMAHASHSGTHSHAHSSYGTQGGDETHDHEHTHSGDSSHNHHAVVVKSDAAMPVGMLSFIASATEGHNSLIDHVHEGDDTMTASAMVASAMTRLGSPWGIAQEADQWCVLKADGSVHWTAMSYAEALEEISTQLATMAADRPVLSTTWRSDMAFEDVDTGDGRYIQPGAIEYRNCPMPLMLQTETASGHFGAVLAGAITETGKVGTTAVGTGSYDDSDAGRQFVDIVNARGRFGVSIDVAEAEGEFECTERDEMGDCTDGRMSFSLIRVMGLTGTPFPAFENAYVENIEPQATGGAVTASGTSDEPCVDCGDGIVKVGVEHPADGTMSPLVEGPLSRARDSLIASAGPAKPPKSWFDDPHFGKSVDGRDLSPASDDRLVRQPDGQYLCPMTITAAGEVFGHFAGWETCHTAYLACTPPPHSRTGYAAFHLRPLETAEGDLVTVGHLAMGCGHIDDDGTVPLDTVRAFYDGGPGAILAARMRCGEDRFGGWFHGALAEDLTDAQIRKLNSLSVSGHWREVWRGKGLDLLCCVAGVPVPGYPVSAMAAAGFTMDPPDVLPAPRAVFSEGRIVALVAAGVVRQPMPWERMIARQAHQIDELTLRLERVERVASPLRPLAAATIRDGLATTG